MLSHLVLSTLFRDIWATLYLHVCSYIWVSEPLIRAGFLCLCATLISLYWSLRLFLAACGKAHLRLYSSILPVQDPSLLPLDEICLSINTFDIRGCGLWHKGEVPNGRGTRFNISDDFTAGYQSAYTVLLLRGASPMDEDYNDGWIHSLGWREIFVSRR